MVLDLHPEYAETGCIVPDGRIQGRGQPQAQHIAGLGRIEDAVIPQVGSAVIGIALLERRFDNRFPDKGQLFRVHGRLPGPFPLVIGNGNQNVCRLGAAHHADLVVGPGPEKARAVGPAAHGVVAGTEGGPHHDRKFGYRGGGHRVDHFVAVFGDPAALVILSDDKTGDVLQEHQGYFTTVAKLDKLGGFQRTFREKDAVVAQDAHWIAVDVGETADQGRTVHRLEFRKLAAVYDAGDDLPDVIGGGDVPRYDAVGLFGIVQGRLRVPGGQPGFVGIG